MERYLKEEVNGNKKEEVIRGGNTQVESRIMGISYENQVSIERKEKRGYVFFILQCRILQALGFISNDALRAFSDAHINLEETESAFLRELIEEEFKEMGNDGVNCLWDELNGMEDPYTGYGEVVTPLVESLKEDFLTGFNTSVISNYVHRGDRR